jgi:hypothetical protein
VKNFDPTTDIRIAEEIRARIADGKYRGRGLGPRKARKAGPAERRLIAERLFDERLPKWTLRGDDLDAKKVRERFAKLSLRLPEQTIRQLLETAESIGSAENAKAMYNPKANRKQYRRLSRTAVSAAMLAIEIAEILPPPWEAERAPIRGLVAGLASFMDGALMATLHASGESLSKIRDAHKLLHATRRPLRAKTGKTYWELIRDLVWLVAGKKRDPLSERTIRRYLEKPNQQRIPEKVYWNSHWNLLVSVERLVPARHADPFEMAAVRYLTTLD